MVNADSNNPPPSAWYQDPEVIVQLPKRYRAVAGYLRLALKIQPKSTKRGHVRGGRFLMRLVGSVSASLHLASQEVLDLDGVHVACDFSESRTTSILGEARGGTWQDAFYRSVLAPGDGVLDIGANGGGMVALACRIVEASGAVFAIEPQPHLAALVRKTLELNNPRGRVFEMAASDEDGVGTLVIPDGLSGSASLGQSGEGRSLSVKIGRVDDLFEKMEDQPIRLVKVDVEGNELRALKGARELLARWRPTILFEFNVPALEALGASPDDLLDWLESQHYAFAEIGDEAHVRSAAEIDRRGSRDLIAVPL